MYSQPCDGINGLAARANVAHGRGVGSPYPASRPSYSRWTHPLAGDCDHGKQSVGEALVYSRLAAPLGRSTSSPRLAGGPLPASFLTSQPADDSGTDCSDMHETRLSPVDKMCRDGFALSEILSHSMPLHCRSRALKHLDSPWFHSRRWELNGGGFAKQQNGVAAHV